MPPVGAHHVLPLAEVAVGDLPVVVPPGLIGDHLALERVVGGVAAAPYARRAAGARAAEVHAAARAEDEVVALAGGERGVGGVSGGVEPRGVASGSYVQVGSHDEGGVRAVARYGHRRH